MDRKRPPAADSSDQILDAAMACHQHGDLAGAVTGYRRALEKSPNDVDAGHLLGLALWQSGQQQEGLRLVMAAADAKPASAAIQNNLGGMLMQARQFAQAERAFRAALAANPTLTDAWSNLAAVLLDLGRADAAEKAARKALALDANRADAWSNLGVALLELGRFNDAEACQQKALSFNPRLAVAHANLGTLRRRRGDTSALAAFRRAVELEPDQPIARFNLSLDHLAQGRLDEGWHWYEERFKARQRAARRELDIPFWQGEMLERRHLLIWPEQGLGDEILFASIFPDLRGLDGPVTVECEPRLLPLFARSFPHLRIAAAGTTPVADVQIAAGSLPGMARPTLSRFNGTAWLVPDTARVAPWRHRLAQPAPALTIGFCWRSGLRSGERQGLYPSLADFAPLFALPGVRWVPLQYDLDQPETAAELAAGLPDGLDLFRPDIDLRDDIDGVAALMGALDLVISAATAVSELAAAVGATVWRVGSADDWTRLGTAARPWCSSMRCFTDRKGGFTRTLADMAAELRRHLPPDRPVQDAEEVFQTAVSLLRAGRPSDAVPLLERAATLRPGHAPTLSRLGSALRLLRRLDEACACYAQAWALQPDNPLIGVNLALCHLDAGQWDRAQATLSRVLDRFPDVAHAHDALGLVLFEQGDRAGAIAAHQRAVRLDPNLLAGWVNLAAALRAEQRFADAVAVLGHARTIDPERVEVWANLGYALFRTGNQAGAEAALERALALVPGYAPALIDLSRIREAQGRPLHAADLLDRVLSADPDNVHARSNRAYLLLANGQLPDGWADYRCRFASGQVTPDRRFSMPVWQGQDLQGRRLLIWREQGLGDEILFGGMIGDLQALGADLIVECDRRMISLFARSYPGVSFRAQTDQPTDADFHIPMGDLPGIVRHSMSAFPRLESPWLRPDPEKVRVWRDRLAALPSGLRVGLCWRSRDMSGDRRQAYLSLADLIPVLSLPGIVPISLQYDGAAAELAAIRGRGIAIHSFDDIDLTHDLETAAALTACLDLVITAPTSVGEMAGALGVPVWRFQNGADWSGLGAAVRPWHATMRVFTSFDVRDVVPRLRQRLQDLVSPEGPAQTVPPPVAQVMALHQSGDLAGAEAGYRAILSARPYDADACHLLSQVVLMQGRGPEALPLVERALALDGNFPAAHNTLGSLLKGMGRMVEAERAFRQALAHRVNYPEAWTNLGATLNDLRRYTDAEKAQRRALAQRPDYPRALVNLGITLRHQGRYAEAETCHRQALAQSPGMAEAWSDLGLCLAHLGQKAEAVACQERALSIDPTYAEAAVNLAVMQMSMQGVNPARQTLARALDIRPGFAPALYNDALLALSVGDLSIGWQRHEARFDSGVVVCSGPTAVPQWDGSPLAGRHLLVWREQGLGDELLFASLYGRLAALGGKVTIWADARLTGPLSRAFPFAEIVADGTSVAADCQIAAGGLARLLCPSLSTWIGPAFLSPDSDRVDLWRDRLAALPSGLRVGLCWRSQLRSAARDGAYTQLTDWLPLLRLPGIQVISLQYDGGEVEIEAVERAHGVRVHRWPGIDQRDDLESAMALMAGLDLVISVATAVGEMAGALGVPVWRVSGEVDWTRLGSGCRPWFASMRWFPVPMGWITADMVPTLVSTLSGLCPTTPDGDPDGWLGRGVALQRAGDPASAIPFYRAIIAREGEAPAALHLLGLALHQTGHAGEGEPFMERALRVAPDYTAAWVNLGNLRQELDQPVAAEVAYRRALSLHPADAVTWTNLGNALRAQGRLDEAAKAHHRAIGFDKAWSVPHANLAVVLKDQDRLEPALAAFRTALSLGEATATLRAGLGDVLRQMGDKAGAARELDAALALNPTEAEAWNSLGRVAEACGDKILARGHYDRALNAQPLLASARYNLGQMDLAAGALSTGWGGYAARFLATPAIRGRAMSAPVWDGRDLDGKRLLVWGEQGLGDQLMFATLYPALIQRCGHLIVETDARLVSLFARAFPQATVRSASPDAGDADRSVAAGDVARHLWGALGALSPQPYLTANTDLVSIWCDRLSALGPGLKIGVCWRSATLNAERSPSYFRLADLAPLAVLPGVTLINLQRGGYIDRWDRADFSVVRFDDLDLDDDLEGQAALIANLDLVITAPTAVGEMAGALGIPVWRLGAPDWTRLGTAVRPWFPTMELPDQGQGMAAALLGLACKLDSLR